MKINTDHGTRKTTPIRCGLFAVSTLLSATALAGLPPKKPVPVDIQAGASVCDLMSNGQVDCWGLNNQGQVGVDAAAFPTVNVETPVQGLGIAKAIAVGGLNHACAILVSGEVKCWGTNAHGELGSSQNAGSFIPNPNPVNVVGLAGPATAISAGEKHTCAIVSVGGGSIIQCWGDNSWLQLGSNIGAWSATPVTVPGISTAHSIAAGQWSTCALIDASWSPAKQVCWGENFEGSLGIGVFSSPSTPGPLIVGPSIKSLSAGPNSRSACGVYVDGTLHCWGWNQIGELGDGTQNSQPSPVPLNAPHKPSAVSGSNNGRCLIDSGAVYCWGSNGNGELGIGIAGPALLVPGPAAVPSGASAVAQGASYVCAVVVTRVKCWGSNANGNLGDGTYNDSYVPISTVF